VTTLLRVVNESRRSVLGSRIRLVGSVLGRTRGFLLRQQPNPGEGMFLMPCKGVHMFGMRFPLDVVFGNAEGVVLATHQELRPGRRTPVYGAAQFALELPCGTIAATGTRVGDRLNWRPGKEATAARKPGASEAESVATVEGR